VADIKFALHAVDRWKLTYLPREINKGAHVACCGQVPSF
jgi:hypothetical protein